MLEVRGLFLDRILEGAECGPGNFAGKRDVRFPCLVGLHIL